MSKEKDNKIIINENYELHYDVQGNKFIYKKYVVKKGKNKGEVVWRNFCGYHWHFSNLLKAFCDKRIAEQDATEVNEFLEKIAYAEKEMQEIADRIGEELDRKFEGIR